MKTTIKNLSPEHWLAIILGILVVITIVTQIIVNCIREQTGLETTLFSLLQFIFSLAFAWVLAKISYRAEFINSQKQFAIAAFRRITEIDFTVERVVNRTMNQMKTADANTHKELEIVLEISKGIRQSIKSSIADWSDIIGNELATIDKIESLTYQEEIISEKIKNPTENQSADESIEKLEKKQNEVKNLLESLPHSLQVSTKRQSIRNTNYNLITQNLKDELKENDFITLNGFWDDTFDKDILNFKVGDKLIVRYGDVASRIASMIAYDQDGNSVGVITNRSDASYSEFFNILVTFLRKSKFEVEILNIDEPNNDSKHHNFKVRIL